MTLTELSLLACLIEELNVSTDNHDAITAITTFLKGANPHSLTCDALCKLEEVIKDQLDSMDYWDIDKIDAIEKKEGIETLSWRKCPVCDEPCNKIDCLSSVSIYTP